MAVVLIQLGIVIIMLMAARAVSGVRILVRLDQDLDRLLDLPRRLRSRVLRDQIYLLIRFR